MVAKQDVSHTQIDRRLQALRSMVRKAIPSGSQSLRNGDLGNRQQVKDYGASAENMWRYTHMYAAKHVAAWRVARHLLEWPDEADRPLVVVGSGPLLCAAGWTLYDAPRTVKAFDVLDWSPVLKSKVGRKLCRSIGQVELHTGVYCPMGAQRVPAQLQHLNGIRPMKGKDVPRNATVLMPMMLNHLMEDGKIPKRTRRALKPTFDNLKKRECRVVIADLANRHSTSLWSDLAHVTGAPRIPGVLDLSQAVSCLEKLYRPEHRDYRTFQNYPQGARLRMMAWNGQHWLGVNA